MVVAADADGDGDNDLVASAYNGAEVFWYEQRNIDAATVYTGRLIKNNVDAVESVFPTDADGRDGDAVAAWSGEDAVAWYESDGSESFTELIITTLADLVRSAVAADLDGDGDAGRGVASQDDDTVAWYENDGAQSFTRHVLTTLADYAGGPRAAPGRARGASARRRSRAIDADGDGDATCFLTERIITTLADGVLTVYAIDVDGDGDVDALAGSSYDYTVAWHENDGSQSFTKRVITTNAEQDSSQFAFGIFAIDVDWDGDVDALSASVGADLVAWYENDGSQSFAARGQLRRRLRHRRRRRRDVDPLSAADYGDTVSWYENDGSQSFAERVITDAADGANMVFAIDVDGDGDADALSVSSNDDTATHGLLRSVTFAERIVTTLRDGAVVAYAIDVDGDGDVDTLLASNDDDTVAWYENDGSQSFTERIITAADNPAPPRAIDADGDGDVDALAGSIMDDTVAWYENDGSQSFTERIITTLAVKAFSVFALDLDGDGDVDALSASKDDDTVAWYENDGSQSFTERIITTLADDGRSVFAIDVDGDGDLQSFAERVITTLADGAFDVFAVDVDGDGDVDALSASYEDDTVAWYENDGLDGTISGATATTGRDGSGALSFDGTDDYVDFPAAVTADILGDARTTSSTASDVFVVQFWNYYPDVELSGSDDGDWHHYCLTYDGSDWTLYFDGSQADTGTVAANTGTFNNLRLGHWYSVDYAIEYFSGAIDEVYVYSSALDAAAVQVLYDAVTSFTERIVTTLADYAQSVFAIDVDGDGDVDALSASYYDDTVAWYENDGSQSFTERIVTTLMDGAKSVIAIDSFTDRIITTLADGGTSAFAIDVDGDGDVDVLSASYTDDTVAWCENDGSLSFTRHVITTLADNAQSVFAIDVDGDGDVDPLSASYGDSTVAWYENDCATLADRGADDEP
ncbi:6-phosphogluconolactonase [Aureococcus anophagefferens]|nr:6-phosphogluconolactonase [Aureococcus anophagefferens]